MLNPPMQHCRNFLATALAWASLCLLTPVAALATTSHAFTMTAMGDGPYTGRSYLGSFSYDDTSVVGSGEEILSLNFGALQVSFDFEGQAFDAAHDVNFDSYPQLTLVDGSPVFLDYLLVRGVNGVSFGVPDVMQVSVQGPLVALAGAPGFSIQGSVALVPEPATTVLLALGLLTLSWRRLGKAGR